MGDVSMRTMFDLPETARRPSGRSRSPRAAAPVSERCPFEANTAARDAWMIGKHDADSAYVACNPFSADRERAVAYLHGFHTIRAGTYTPVLPWVVLDAAWAFGAAVAAAGTHPEAAFAKLTAAIEQAFEQSYAAAARDG